MDDTQWQNQQNDSWKYGGYENFPWSTQLIMAFIMLNNVKMPTIVGILIFISMKITIPTIVDIVSFISMINTISESLKAIHILLTCLSHPVLFYWPFQGGASFGDPFCYLCLSLLYWLVCSLQLCDHLLGRGGGGWPLGSLVCDVFLCFVTFPYGVPDQVWYLIISIPDLCLLPYLAECTIYVAWFVMHRFLGSTKRLRVRSYHRRNVVTWARHFIIRT